MNNYDIKMKRKLGDRLAPLTVLHWVFWTNVGAEVLLEFAHHDLSDVHKSMRSLPNGGLIEVEGHVTSQYSCTPEVTLRLLKQLHAVCHELVNSGLIDKRDIADALKVEAVQAGAHLRVVPDIGGRE